MDGTLLAAQGNLSLVVPLVFVCMIVVYGVYRFRFHHRTKNDNRKEQEVRKIFY